MNSRRTTAYLVLVAIFSLPGYWLFAHPDVLPARLSSAILMWAPGSAGLVALLTTGGEPRSIGWRLGRPRFLVAAMAIPLVGALPVYALVWSSETAAFAPARWSTAIPYGMTTSSTVAAAAYLLTFGLLDKLTRALGEEIGWHRVLLPELARHMTPTRAALLSGLVWGLWHLPAIAFGRYHAGGVPLGAQIGFFAILVMSFGMITAWLRLASGSVWPCVLAHAFHNLMVQSFLDRATVDLGGATWWTGEFGAGVPVLYAALGLAAWRQLRRMPPLRSGDPAAPAAT